MSFGCRFIFCIDQCQLQRSTSWLKKIEALLNSRFSKTGSETGNDNFQFMYTKMFSLSGLVEPMFYMLCTLLRGQGGGSGPKQIKKMDFLYCNICCSPSYGDSGTFYRIKKKLQCRALLRQSWHLRAVFPVLYGKK